MVTIQKNFGDWTFIVNGPDVEKVIVGRNKKAVFEIGWRGEASYQIAEHNRLGIQFYGSLGEINNITPIGQQQHYVIPTLHTVLFACNTNFTWFRFWTNAGLRLIFS